MKNLFVLFIAISFCSIAQQQNKQLRDMNHQFDFWLGKWDVYKFGTETFAGKSHIESINDSTALLENYTNATGKYIGKSLNKYNSVKQQWEQYWVDNSGLTLHLAGGIKDNRMILTDEFTGDNKQGINQIIWEKLPNGNVRQTWRVSTDNGKTWKLIFDGEYKRSK